MQSALVLSGETDLVAAASVDRTQAPDYVLGHIDHLLPASAWAQRGWRRT